jgi:hypothetical protein
VHGHSFRALWQHPQTFAFQILLEVLQYWDGAALAQRVPFFAAKFLGPAFDLVQQPNIGQRRGRAL